VTYTGVATILGATPQGWLTASLPAASGFDTASTLAVDLSESGGTLTSTTDAAAQGGVSLCLVGSELIAFATATLTAPNKYNLTRLQRGLYGTVAAAHSAGTSFSYVATTSVDTAAIPAQWIGQKVYLKFQSFNVFYQGALPLDQCLVYIFTPTAPTATGQSLDTHPIAAALASGTPVDLGSVAAAPPTVTDDFGLVIQPASGFIGLGPTTFSPGASSSMSSDSSPGPIDLGDVFSVDPIGNLLQMALPDGVVDFGDVMTAPTTSGDFSAVQAPPELHVDLETGSFP
jgi:hypothetical protein